jgi:ubiquinone/menaquinone biosynthesis C-methylase UbiE
MPEDCDQTPLRKWELDGSVGGMNKNHARVCPSPEWAQYLQTDIIPSVTNGVRLGSDLIEVGPGPGAATDWLRHQVTRLVAVEHEQDAAEALADRFADTNVEVINGDATRLPFPADSFDSAACFTMLHHVPTAALQNQLLAEVWRVLRPGGVLIGSDSLASDALHHFHEGDTYNPVEPASLLTRLLTIGYDKVTVAVDRSVRFIGHKPLPDPTDGS